MEIGLDELESAVLELGVVRLEVVVVVEKRALGLGVRRDALHVDSNLPCRPTVVHDEPMSKLTKAQSLGITIIDEAAFERMRGETETIIS